MPSEVWIRLPNGAFPVESLKINNEKSYLSRIEAKIVPPWFNPPSEVIPYSVPSMAGSSLPSGNPPFE